MRSESHAGARSQPSLAGSGEGRERRAGAGGRRRRGVGRGGDIQGSGRGAPKGGGPAGGLGNRGAGSCGGNAGAARGREGAERRRIAGKPEKSVGRAPAPGGRAAGRNGRGRRNAGARRTAPTAYRGAVSRGRRRRRPRRSPGRGETGVPEDHGDRRRRAGSGERRRGARDLDRRSRQPAGWGPTPRAGHGDRLSKVARRAPDAPPSRLARTGALPPGAFSAGSSRSGGRRPPGRSKAPPEGTPTPPFPVKARRPPFSRLGDRLRARRIPAGGSEARPLRAAVPDAPGGRPAIRRPAAGPFAGPHSPADRWTRRYRRKAPGRRRPGAIRAGPPALYGAGEPRSGTEKRRLNSPDRRGSNEPAPRR